LASATFVGATGSVGSGLGGNHLLGGSLSNLFSFGTTQAGVATPFSLNDFVGGATTTGGGKSALDLLQGGAVTGGPTHVENQVHNLFTDFLKGGGHNL
jgi:hypothetical protein